jgi:DNA-binding response OmpR family regulator
MNKQTVLIVDLDRVIADTLQQIFSSKGYEAKAFYDAESALTASEHWRPNLAILEVILMNMSGLDCAIRLKARYPDCQIILLNAVVADFVIQKALDLNFEVLSKPVPPEELLATARALLESNHQ